MEPSPATINTWRACDRERATRSLGERQELLEGDCARTLAAYRQFDRQHTPEFQATIGRGVGGFPFEEGFVVPQWAAQEEGESTSLVHTPGGIMGGRDPALDIRRQLATLLKMQTRMT